MTRTRLFVIFGLSGVGTLGISLLLFFTLTGHEKSAHTSSTAFATALVNQNASLAPKGALDYFDGIQANFGPVKSARVIDTRNTSHGSGQSAHTYFVGDVLLETAKGPMVVELTFNGGMLVKGYDKVTGIEELAPVDVPDDALSDGEFVALAKAFVARGGRPADNTQLDGTWLDSAQRTPRKPNALQKAIRKAIKTPAPPVEAAGTPAPPIDVDDMPAMKQAASSWRASRRPRATWRSCRAARPCEVASLTGGGPSAAVPNTFRV